MQDLMLYLKTATECLSASDNLDEIMSLLLSLPCRSDGEDHGRLHTLTRRPSALFLLIAGRTIHTIYEANDKPYGK